MDFGALRYSRHAFERMFERNITPDSVARIVESGETIARYAEDSPYPSCLLLGFDQSGPLHVVVAGPNEDGLGIIVTVYRPRPEFWSSDFKSKVKK